MKVFFLTRYFNHHQSPFSEAMYSRIGDGYRFVETAVISAERKNLGWGIEKYPPYVLRPAVSSEFKQHLSEQIDAADAVLMGGAPDAMLKLRHRKKKLTIRYSERFYKKPCPKWQIPLRYVRNYLRLGRHKNEYMLCASAYTAGDLAMTHTFLGKTYKWGYFPEAKHYDLEQLFSRKGENACLSLLWAGRFLSWKHPEAAIALAMELKSRGYSFTLQIIGNGPLEEELRQVVREKGLQEYVFLLGAMKPEQVRVHMEQADIFLFTSDRNEGWGAVLNESMNSGCAVVASHAIGSVPFLIRQGENGIIYRDGDQNSLNAAVIALMEDSAFRETLGKNAYHTIADLWNADVAAERLIQFIGEIQKTGGCDLFEDGPCSRAQIIKDGCFDQCFN